MESKCRYFYEFAKHKKNGLFGRDNKETIKKEYTSNVEIQHLTIVGKLETEKKISNQKS